MAELAVLSIVHILDESASCVFGLSVGLCEGTPHNLAEQFDDLWTDGGTAR